MSDACCPDEFIGAEPAQVKWRVVRGDTASIMVQFLEDDETTSYDTSTWTYAATAYEAKDNRYDDLDVEVSPGYIKITAAPSVTATWGVGTKTAELSFDLQVTIDGTTVWTPIIGTISVIGDVTGI
jgi:hypothetical protein